MKTKQFIIVSLLIFTLLLSGCGSQSDSEAVGSEENETTKVLVGTEGTYSPFNFVDEDGEITGYDVEVVKEIDKRIDDLEFEFVTAQWDSLFLGLESGKYDMIADQINKSPEREKKYFFTENSYFSAVSNLIVRENEDEIKTIDDLKGKKVGVSVGTNFAMIFEDYNKENDNAIDIQYFEGNITSTLQDIEAGRLDATINDKLIATNSIEELGLKLKIVGEPIKVSPSYFVFNKDDESKVLISKVDEALDEMKADGTLAEISIKWFGEDYTSVE